MWQAIREELHPKGLEIVSVGLDTLGAEGCQPFIEAANPTHPSLIDEHHALARLFGVINIPSSVWINEEGVIVRPAEAAPIPRSEGGEPNFEFPEELPQRFAEMFGEAMKIESDPEAYHAALRDWVDKGSESEFALSPEEVIGRSRPRNADSALGHAHFELATALEKAGDHAAAMDGLLGLMMRDRGYGDDAARQALLKLFDMLGDDPMVAQARRRMFNLLH